MSNARQPIGSGMANTRQPMGTGRAPTTTQTVGNTRQPSASPSGGARQPIGAVTPSRTTGSALPVEPMVRVDSGRVGSGFTPTEPRTTSSPNARAPVSNSRVAPTANTESSSTSLSRDSGRPPVTPTFQNTRTPTGPRPLSGITPSGATSNDPSAPRTNQPARVSTHNRSRRISKIFIEKEKKSDYWQEVIEEVNTQGVFNQDDINNFIARAVSLEVVSNFKDREAQGGAPLKASELVAKVSDEMYKHIVELNNGRGVNVPGTGLEKIKNMERFLLALEAKKEKEAEIEAQKVQAKIGELTQNIQAKEREKNTERENNRRSIMVEMSDLKEQMKNVGNSSNSAADARAMTQKMLMMEQSLRKMNEDKGKEDQDTVALKKKLAVFEAKMKQLEEEKVLRAQADNADGLRDKLILMEEKLAKMERRKSVSITLMMQQQMQKLEEELKSVRSSGGGGGDAKVQALEKKLLEMQNAKIDVNDPETRHLRSHIKKLEEQMLQSERSLEEQAQRMEMERRMAQKKRDEEEELTRKRNAKRDELFIEQMQRLEDKIKNGGGVDAQKIKELEARLMSGGGGGDNPAIAKQMKELQDRLAETEQRLAAERNQSSQFWDVLNGKSGQELEAAQKDLTIMFLKTQTEELMKRLDEQANLMKQKFEAIDTKIEKVAAMGPVGGGPVVRNTGMSYEELQKKMEEIQVKLFDENIDERESEALNIEYEKLVTELESTKEYQAEQAAIVQKWKDENLPLNKLALEKLRAELASFPPMKKTAALKRKPELKFLDCDFDQINKKHVNDFKGLTTQNLTLEETRALYACMPEFRKDQEAQLQFVGQLKEKIENEMKKPKIKPPPPIVAKNPVVFKPKPQRGGGGGEGGGDFLAELMKKRKQQG